MSDDESRKRERKTVVWDETNLSQNEEYQRLHPVTMKIDEPKTPYEPERAMDEEGNFIDETTPDKVPVEKTEADGSSWDPKVNANVKQIKMTVPLKRVEISDPDASPVFRDTPKEESLSSSQNLKKELVRPTLGISTCHSVNEKHAELVEEEQHKAEFKHMRKAVYADEGAKFKALLGKSVDELDDEDLNDDETA